MKRLFLPTFLLLGIATQLVAQNASIIRGPYLQKGSEFSMTIKWRTDVATAGEIHYGTDPNSLNGTVTFASGTDQEASIINLSSDTRYYYEITDGTNVLAGGTTDFYFETHPPTYSQELVRGWVLGDAGTANGDQRAVRDAYYNYVGAEHTDMILFLGDNAYDSGTDAEYQNALFENMYEAKLQNTISWSCLGNHDGYSANSSDMSGPYYDIFALPQNAESGGVASGTEAYYSFNYGNIHFVCLDSYDSDRSESGPMHTWLENDLAAHTSDWLVAFWHHPPYSRGSHTSDIETELVQMRNNFLPLLEDHGVDVVFCGHSHSYERSYMIHDHYNLSFFFSQGSNADVGGGDGDGRVDGDGAYQKTISGNDAGVGTVYLTAGSSGKTSGGLLNHPAMFISLNELGSCVFEAENNQMNVKFINDQGNVADHFTINKDFSLTTGVEEPTMKFVVHPNPSDGFVTLKSQSPLKQRLDVCVFAMDGRMVHTEKWSEQAKTLDLTELPKGSYVLKILGSKEIYSETIVIH